MRTRTAKRADWHIADPPGHRRRAGARRWRTSSSATACVDEDYVARHTVGFDELRRAARRLPARRASSRSPASRRRTSSASPASTPRTQPAAIRVGVAIERHAQRRPGGPRDHRRCPRSPAPGATSAAASCSCSHWAFPVNGRAMQPPGLDPPGHAGRQPVAARAGADRRARARPAGQGAVRLQRQPRGRRRRDQGRMLAGLAPRGPLRGRRRAVHDRHRPLRRHRAAEHDAGRADSTSSSRGARCTSR